MDLTLFLVPKMKDFLHFFLNQQLFEKEIKYNQFANIDKEKINIEKVIGGCVKNKNDFFCRHESKSDIT